ncbi:hypothetical protein BOX15_Mlig017514g2 [Macrostomum lignano]|uniref:OB domain-containing protein n=2 Tax=Macrostomum lignano TaxID=282301 RepID=A0A267EL37_9PLAT|nr:hypothetical protein BOX15_Mlig017514g3 [Macrostomum lignano]PAA64429.1 hypothetical protein BOX15_Mlig017514g2 [Macrostomum lignano]
MSHQFVHLKDLRPMQKNVNVHFIVLEVYDPTRTKDGNEVRNVSIADRTGRMTLALWNDHGRQVHPGDICRVLNGLTTVFKQEMTLNVGKNGELQKTGDFMMVFSEKPNLSEMTPDMLAKMQEMNAAKAAPQSGSGGAPSAGRARGGPSFSSGWGKT